MAEPAIKVIPTSYAETLALLRSDALRSVEEAIAHETADRIVVDESSAATTSMQADLSVSGMTVAEAEALLLSRRDEIVRFGVAFLKDETATSDAEEYPAGEEQDPSETVEMHGLARGFGVKYAIYFNFLANRPATEFAAYLKNRRIPGAAKFARELRAVFESLR